jgi:hypothetical protein
MVIDAYILPIAAAQYAAEAPAVSCYEVSVLARDVMQGLLLALR